MSYGDKTVTLTHFGFDSTLEIYPHHIKGIEFGPNGKGGVVVTGTRRGDTRLFTNETPAQIRELIAAAEGKEGPTITLHTIGGVPREFPLAAIEGKYERCRLDCCTVVWEGERADSVYVFNAAEIPAEIDALISDAKGEKKRKFTPGLNPMFCQDCGQPESGHSMADDCFFDPVNATVKAASPAFAAKDAAFGLRDLNSPFYKIAGGLGKPDDLPIPKPGSLEDAWRVIAELAGKVGELQGVAQGAPDGIALLTKLVNAINHAVTRERIQTANRLRRLTNRATTAEARMGKMKLELIAVRAELMPKPLAEMSPLFEGPVVGLGPPLGATWELQRQIDFIDKTITENLPAGWGKDEPDEVGVAGRLGALIGTKALIERDRDEARARIAELDRVTGNLNADNAELRRRNAGLEEGAGIDRKNVDAANAEIERLNHANNQLRLGRDSAVKDARRLTEEESSLLIRMVLFLKKLERENEALAVGRILEARA